MVERAQPGLREVAGRAPWLRGSWSLSRAAARAVALLALVAADLAVLAFAMSAVVAVRVSILPGLSHAFSRPTYPVTHYLELWWIPLAYLGALAYAGLYTRRDPYWEEVRRCLLGATAGAVLMFAILSVAKIGDDVSRPVVVVAWAVLLVALPLVRGAVKEALFAVGLWRRAAVLVGDGALARTLVGAFRRHRTLGYDVVEVIADPGEAPERAAMLGAREVILAIPQL